MDPSQLLQRQDTQLSSSAQLDGLTDTPASKTLQTPVSQTKSAGKGAAGSMTGLTLNLGVAAGVGVGVGVGAPRIDTEPIYTALKAALGDSFGPYRDAIAGFVLGKLSQAELSLTLSHTLSQAPSVTTNPASPESRDAKLTSTLHLHNQLLCALYANIFRDTPPDPIAPWVLAPDDASALSQHGAKGAAHAGAANHVEERVKRAVMALSARDRRRIKSVKEPDTPSDIPAHPLSVSLAYERALSVPTSNIAEDATLLEGKGSLAKTNWDIEIRRRYAMPLASETLEFPSRPDIQSRIEPICYEEGVGLTANTPMSTATLNACAELIETAAEMYLKEILERWFSATRTNGEGMPLTSAFRKQLRKEEVAVERGELARTAAGLLPCEADVVAHREPLTIDDLRTTLRVDDCRLPQDPFLANSVLSEPDVDMDVYNVPTPPDDHHPIHHLTNGVNGIKDDTAAPDGLAADPMVVDDEDLGWYGAGQEDRDALMGVLDDAMAVGF